VEALEVEDCFFLLTKEVEMNVVWSTCLMLRLILGALNSAKEGCPIKEYSSRVGMNHPISSSMEGILLRKRPFLTYLS